MPTFEKSEDWFKQSVLLLQARPTTTRVTTKYKIVKCKPARPSKKAKTTADTTTNTVEEYPPSAVLKLKTYDPVSGACLQYKTKQAAEVGRLIAGLGKLGKTMATLEADDLDNTEDMTVKPDDAGDVVMKDASVEQSASTQQSQQQSGGGGGKKKKGKR